MYDLGAALEACAPPHALLFVTISGAHLYGFPSPDSDWDLRGVHVTPARDLMGLDQPPGTIEVNTVHQLAKIDLVTHDVGKYFKMMLGRNGYVLEQILSPLVVRTTPEHEELKALGKKCVTRHHARHYLGFAAREWTEIERAEARRVKKLLYVFRVLLTGLHLMRSGEVEANLLRLNDEYKLPFIPDLISLKVGGCEKMTANDAPLDFYRGQYHRLMDQLESAMAQSGLPDLVDVKPALNDLLVRIRLSSLTRV